MLDQIAKVNYKYSYSLANAIQSRGIDIKMVIDQKQEQENARFERVKLFNTDEKNVGKFSKLINYIRSYKKIYKIKVRNIGSLYNKERKLCETLE